MTRMWFRYLLGAVVLAVAAQPLRAQDPGSVARDTNAVRSDNFIHVRPDSSGDPSAWNSPRALALVEEARARRQVPRGDTGLTNYHSKANGYVYFFLDRNDAPGKTLVKVDQIALDVYWAAPDRTHQDIVGMRDVSRLPNRMYYHLDHLTVVQNEFSDVIQLGDGDEVRAVLHPAARGAEWRYEYRVADSLTLTIPSAGGPVRVYELAVRPKDVKQPGYIGSMYVDQRTGAIVRMTFTFTPASYVDRRLDYINVSLENGLFEGRYWLPHEQRLEIRRQVPELDFPAGAVIRGVFRIGDYALNQQLPTTLFYQPRITARPEAERKSYAFDSGIYSDLNEEGLSPPPDMATLRAQAAQIVRQKYLSGLPKLRFSLGGASSALRYDRAEGIRGGAGMSWSPGVVSLGANAGYAIASQRLSLAGTARAALPSGTTLRLDVFGNTLQDIGLRPAVPGALNTLSSAFLGTDYLDPYYASGAAFAASAPVGGWTASLKLGGERDGSADLAETKPLFRRSSAFRPVRPIDAGTLLSARAGIGRTADESGTFGWGGDAGVEGGALGGHGFARPTLQLTGVLRSTDHRSTARLTGEAGAVLGSVPAQRLFLIGGPGTLPGYDIRRYAGDRFGLATLDLTRDVFAPFIRVRAMGAVGWTDFRSSSLPAGWDPGPSAPAAWNASTTGGIKASAGFGVGLGWDILRLDLARGLSSGGRWQLVVSVHPELWDML